MGDFQNLGAKPWLPDPLPSPLRVDGGSQLRKIPIKPCMMHQEWTCLFSLKVTNYVLCAIRAIAFRSTITKSLIYVATCKYVKGLNNILGKIFTSFA